MKGRKKLKESTVGNLVVFVGLVIIGFDIFIYPLGMKFEVLALAFVIIGSTTNLLKFLQGIYLILPEEKRDDNS